MKITKSTIILIACIVAAAGISAACLLPAAKAPAAAEPPAAAAVAADGQGEPEAPGAKDAAIAQTGQSKETAASATLLNAAIDNAVKLSAKDYTAESFAALSKALEEAKAAAANTDATQPQIDKARDALLAAIGVLAPAKAASGSAAATGTETGTETGAWEESQSGAEAPVSANAPAATLSIDADTYGAGTILSARAVSFNEGDTVFAVLVRETRANGIHMEFTGATSNAYIDGIANIYEFDGGELSGWMYSVNGWYPNYGCSKYTLKDGDVIKWRYTCDLGADIGGSGVTQG
ncbi:MAG: DUF4430 domain-containing protein [Clostridiales Family XIII bacterium]|jgi:hypothetical protein|nr:DUF4430 domain-containing protein [Clostridiales Family XIII bacterium]